MRCATRPAETAIDLPTHPADGDRDGPAAYRSLKESQPAGLRHLAQIAAEQASVRGTLKKFVTGPMAAVASLFRPRDYRLPRFSGTRKLDSGSMIRNLLQQ
jgi:hypothetical protein